MKDSILLLQLLWLGAACQPGRDGRVTGAGEPVPSPSAPTFYDVGARPRAIAVGDLNGDGHRDVAVANAGDGTVTVLLGNAAGQLGGSASFAAGQEPSDVDALDLDRDGDVDLMFANHETANITVLLNDGRAQFTPAVGSPFNSGARPHVHGLATGDFDDDGWPDVAIESADTREVRILRGGAGPHLLSAPVVVAVGTMPYSRIGTGRVSGNAAPDILVPGHTDNTVRVVESENGALQAASWSIRLAAQPWMVVGGDVNADGRDDMVVVESDATSIWLAGADRFGATPHLRVSIPGATEAAIGDLDADGRGDVAVGPWDGDETIVIMGSGATPLRVRMCQRPVGLAMADLDGDGRAELLATCTTGSRIAVSTARAR